MIFTIVVVITIVSLVGCVCIKKPAVRIGLGIIVALGLMLTVLMPPLTLPLLMPYMQMPLCPSDHKNRYFRPLH